MGWILMLACTITGQGNSGYLGVSGCTATACHGRAEAPGLPEWQSSYSVWASRDQHANAYAVLFSERSREIVAALPGEGLAYTESVKQSCTGCHATASAPSLIADGVSCESCHGPASGWLSTHTLRAAQRPKQMYGTLSLASRANICTECHVGPRKVDGHLYDVNHDLIAAGHPRLTFEFTAYMHSLPPHWRPERTGSGIPAWIEGQAATARASLKLLEERAKVGPVWPEFAEYDCYACHHDLQSGRQSAGTRLGRPEWGVWAFALPRDLADKLKPTRDEMTKPAPDRELVKQLAATASSSIQLPAWDAIQLQAALRAEMPEWRHWEQWTQAYLAARAIALPGRETALRQLRALLEAPGGFNLDDPKLRTTANELLKP